MCVCIHQVTVCWLPSDGGEQCDESGLAAPHPAGVSAGSHHRRIEDSEHPLPPGPQVGTQTGKTHTYMNLKDTVDQLFVMQAFSKKSSSTSKAHTLYLICLNRTKSKV